MAYPRILWHPWIRTTLLHGLAEVRTKEEAGPRGDRDIIIDHFNGKVILGAAGGRRPELEAHTLVPKSAMCFGHSVSLYQSLRVDGIVHDLEDAPAATTSSCVLDHLSPKACLRITPPAMLLFRLAYSGA